MMVANYVAISYRQLASKDEAMCQHDYGNNRIMIMMQTNYVTLH